MYVKTEHFLNSSLASLHINFAAVLLSELVFFFLQYLTRQGTMMIISKGTPTPTVTPTIAGILGPTKKIMYIQ